MRTDTQRLNKFKAKLVGDIAKDRVDKYGDIQKRNFARSIKKQTEIEQEIKNIVGDYTSLIELPYYIIFGKEINKLMEKYQDNLLISELEVLQNKWEDRGLNSILLNNIKTYYVQAYKPAAYFIMDISLLDGPDVLA